ncbi:phospholipid carrier-dependent glycosyltransferase [Rubellimicrobium rubrum]|uniref:Phospholipid carrier-dependent glycosyltransferase n=1 Tax=Rubellimicrobium rubrum TaxID=2585369 RepID=A0A5C4MXI9_9RHOB|nr:glycosyltransferase family 39 protein [Rubellimicrobium rubrum]TNC49441.1 phospholipid carrier-dependent glycosyltransferase [Rubellimicrobium rubrum]
MIAGRPLAARRSGARLSDVRLSDIHLPLTALATMLFAVLCVAFVLLRPLLPIDETRYLTVAWEMWLGGSKLVPHLNGELYGHKPPLLFWLVNAVWSVTGVSELAARLVAPAFGAASVVLTARLARELWPGEKSRAGRAALILATTGVFLVYGSGTMFDTLLTAAVLLAMLALWRLTREGGAQWVLALGAAIALGIYAKGPVVLVHVMPVALLAPLWKQGGKEWSMRRHLGRLGLSLFVAMALVALWLGPALILGGAEYREEVLWRQSAGRMVKAFAHERPWWWFLALLPVYLWPWGWSPAALRSLAPRVLLVDPASRFVALWVMTALVAFSAISGKQGHYLLPELPALALLLSRRRPEGSRLWRLPALLPALVLSGLGLGVALGWIAVPEEQLAMIPAPALLASTALVAALAWALWRWPTHVAAWALVAPLTLLAFHILAAPILAGTYDPAPIGRILASHEEADLAIRDSSYHGQFGFAGRLLQPLALLRDEAALAAWAAEHPGGVVVAPDPIEGTGFPVIARQPFRGHVYTLYQVPEEMMP